MTTLVCSTFRVYDSTALFKEHFKFSTPNALITSRIESPIIDNKQGFNRKSSCQICNKLTIIISHVSFMVCIYEEKMIPQYFTQSGGHTGYLADYVVEAISLHT